MRQLCLAVACGFAALPLAADCVGVDPAPHLESSYAVGWGIDHRNTRYQPKSSIDSGNVASLTLKWVYALGTTAPRSYPLVTEDTIFIGDSGRGLVALDRETGCERWRFVHEGTIGSAIVQGRIGERPVLIFNDRTQGVYVVDAVSGEFVWHSSVDDEPVPWYSATPLVTEKAVYVPVSSLEVGLAVNPLYGCCTTSGGVAAFDIRTGRKLWYLPTIEAEAQPTGSHFFFVQEYGPSGAAVWGAPSYDADRNWLFFGTGQNYTHPTTDTSDAIFAVHADTGKVVWVRQYTANDAYTAACNIKALNHPNCPDPTGPDVDFGAPTMLLRTRAGSELLIAGQKSAEIHAMQPDTGERIWTTRLGRGGIIGGVHWGLAANETLGLIFAPISDKKIMGFPSPGEAAPGLYALDVETGEQQWRYARPSRCDEQECVFGLSAAIIAANDIVVAGSMDGFLEIVAADTGALLWSHDAWQEYDAVNGVTATGGAFDAHGPMLADDLLIVSAGYSYVGSQRGGNALLVFQVEPADE
ncbi:MAG TPA: PQQ-binding-like beta-propeller repeat protein [Pseudomonadales bacterium]